MKTDVIVVSSQGRQMGKALEQAEKVAAYKGLSHKGALHLRLLTEEMMSLMRSITGETEGEFWIEDTNGLYELHLRVETRMTSGKREQLLATSTSGKNESARGLMGRLCDFFDRGADEDIAGLSSPLMLQSLDIDQGTTPILNWDWSMHAYEEMLVTRVERRDAEAIAAWDELEKSVVAHVADDVKMSIRGQTVEMTLLKELA